MVFYHIWLLPVAAVSCALIGMFSGYIIGVAMDHYPPILPFISDGGAFCPEAALFAQFLNMAGFLYAITLYIVHREAVEFYEHYLGWKRTKWWYASLLSMCVGLLASFGLTMVANFRDNEIGIVHGIGALTAFFGMIIYGWSQVIIGYALVPRITSVAVNHIRLIIIALTTCCLALHVLGTLSKVFIPNDAPDFPGWSGDHWFKEDSPFYRTYIIASSSEWAMTLLMQLFILSFVVELRMIDLDTPRVIFKHIKDANVIIETTTTTLEM